MPERSRHIGKYFDKEDKLLGTTLYVWYFTVVQMLCYILYFVGHFRTPRSHIKHANHLHVLAEAFLHWHVFLAAAIVVHHVAISRLLVSLPQLGYHLTYSIQHTALRLVHVLCSCCCVVYRRDRGVVLLNKRLHAGGDGKRRTLLILIEQLIVIVLRFFVRLHTVHMFCYF